MSTQTDAVLPLRPLRSSAVVRRSPERSASPGPRWSGCRPPRPLLASPGRSSTPTAPPAGRRPRRGPARRGQAADLLAQHLRAALRARHRLVGLGRGQGRPPGRRAGPPRHLAELPTRPRRRGRLAHGRPGRVHGAREARRRRPRHHDDDRDEHRAATRRSPASPGTRTTSATRASSSSSTAATSRARRAVRRSAGCCAGSPAPTPPSSCTATPARTGRAGSATSCRRVAGVDRADPRRRLPGHPHVRRQHDRPRLAGRRPRPAGDELRHPRGLPGPGVRPEPRRPRPAGLAPALTRRVAPPADAQPTEGGTPRTGD